MPTQFPFTEPPDINVGQTKNWEKTQRKWCKKAAVWRVLGHVCISTSVAGYWRGRSYRSLSLQDLFQHTTVLQTHPHTENQNFSQRSLKWDYQDWTWSGQRPWMRPLCVHLYNFKFMSATYKNYMLNFAVRASNYIQVSKQCIADQYHVVLRYNSKERNSKLSREMSNRKSLLIKYLRTINDNDKKNLNVSL